MPLLQTKQQMQKESSYQPVRQKNGKMITSEQARNIDEDHHDFDQKPSQSDIDQANYINAKMKKMRKQSQNIKAVEDLNQVVESAKGPLNKVKCNSPYKMKHGESALHFKGANSKNSKCWDGYKKVGTKPSPSGTGETVNDCEKI